MTDSATLRVEPRPAIVASPAARTALVEIALAVGSFGIGTGEFATMGLLPNVAGSLGISEPQAGHIISAYAIGVVVGSPVIAVLAAKRARRSLLLGLMLLFVLGNVLSALAPSFAALVGFRFLAGMPHGAYFGVASLVAASMAAPGKRAQAVGRVMLGLTIATLLGTPAATWFGQNLGWRAAFAAVGSMGLLTMVLVALFVPRDRPMPGASPLRELRRRFRAGCALRVRCRHDPRQHRRECAGRPGDDAADRRHAGVEHRHAFCLRLHGA